MQFPLPTLLGGRIRCAASDVVLVGRRASSSARGLRDYVGAKRAAEHRVVRLREVRTDTALGCDSSLM
jgi:hypothetical protein